MDKFKTNLVEGANWIVIVFIMILYIAMGLMTVENGAIALNDFSSYNWLDWTLWGVMTFVPAIMALVISTTFKKEGIKQGEIKIQPEINAYQALLHLDPNKKVRSKRQFLTEGAIREGAKKFLVALVLSFIAGQLFLNLNTDGVFKIVINISMWGVFGIMAFGKSFNYAVEELKEWYIIETGKLKKIDAEQKEVVANELKAKLAKQKEDLEMKNKGASYKRIQKIRKLETELKLLNEGVHVVNYKVKS